LESALIFGDVQIPCHDPSALEVMMQIGEDLKPDVLVVNGDFVEWRHLSVKYAKRELKEFGANVREETGTAMELLETITKRIKAKKRKFLQGNHEWRLFRALSQIPQVLELLGIEKIAKALSVEAVLGLNALGYECPGEYPAGAWLFDRQPHHNCWIHHSFITRKKAGYQAHAEIDTRLCSTVTGHGERLACVWRRGMDRELFAVEGGNLSILGEPSGRGIYGSIPFNEPAYLDKRQGFVVIYQDGNTMYPFCIPIHRGRAVFNGRLYKA
jgi:Calcineurin-like phosphoesterase